VGKSTFVNALAGCERVVTDQRPGTTRDSIDVVVGRDGQFFTVVDTAGMRRRGRPENAPEYKSLLRSERALERADAVALMLDSMQGVGSIDKRLGALAAASGKPVVIAVNKWDLTADEDTTGEYEEYLSEHLPGLAFAPVVFLSALEHQRVWAVPKLLRELWQLAGRHFRTALLNRAVRRVLAEQPPPTSKGRLPRIRFAVHTGIRPQRFSVRTVNAAFLHQSYRRFFDNRLRRELGLEELPVIIKFEEKR
jgi:GTP-binding protein